MGKRGPAPKPTALRLLHGDRKDRVNTAEPVPASSEITPPTALSEGAQAVWDRLAPDLIAKKVLTSWDVDEFALFCDAAARQQAAREALDRHGEVVEVPILDRHQEVVGSRFVTSPWWQVWKGANEAVLRFGARFGLSPSDRSQLKVGDGERKSDKERLLS